MWTCEGKGQCEKILTATEVEADNSRSENSMLSTTRKSEAVNHTQRKPCRRRAIKSRERHARKIKLSNTAQTHLKKTFGPHMMVANV